MTSTLVSVGAGPAVLLELFPHEERMTLVNSKIIRMYRFCLMVTSFSFKSTGVVTEVKLPSLEWEPTPFLGTIPLSPLFHEFNVSYNSCDVSALDEAVILKRMIFH